jgi:predicted helicase
MRNLVDFDNVGLVTTRLQKENPGAFIARTAITHKVFNSYDSNSLFPLYVYHEDGTRTPNFNSDELKKLTANLSTEPTPENILDYIYAVLHSPSYRAKYAEFLKTDFPRVPVIPSDTELNRLASLGKRLRNLHLMTAPISYTTTYPNAGTDMVDKINYSNNQVFINDTQYFGNIPELAWNFYIGGYQPAQKWLKDRKGKQLSNSDLDHYQKIITVLLETDSIMQKIG